MANEFKVRKGLVVNGSGSVILDVQGSQGQLFSVTDQLSGSIFAVKDISGMPVIEAFSDDRVNIGTFNREAIKVSGSVASVTGSFSGSFSGSLFGTSSWAQNSLTASYALGGSANAILYQTASAATTWSFNHFLQTQYPVFTIYDSSNNIIIPQRVFAQDTSSALIYFSAPTTGIAVASKGGYSASVVTSATTANTAITASYALLALSASNAPGFTFTFSQSLAAVTWSINHNMNTRTPLVQVYDINYNQLVPNQVVSVTQNLTEVRFDYGQNGYAVLSSGAAPYVTGSTSLLNQTTPAVTWSFAHNLNSKYVNFQVYDSTDYTIIPSNIKAIDTNNAEIHLAYPMTGVAVANFSGINGQMNAATASYVLPLNQNVIVTGSLTLNPVSIPSTNNPALIITGSVSASAALAQGANFNPTLVAAANSDELITLDINPTFNTGSFTTVRTAGLRVQGIYFSRGNNLSSTSNIAIGNNTTLYRSTNGNNNIAIGNTALSTVTTGVANVAVGNNALQNAISSNNVAIGYLAAQSLSAAGSIVAIGLSALQNNTGAGNVAVGANALQATSTGGNNTAVGLSALSANTGTNNTAIGQSTISAAGAAANNVAVGSFAMYVTTTSTNNIAVGSNALRYAGSGTGTNSTTTSNGVYIGYDVRSSANGNTNEIVISGYNGSSGSIGNGSNTTIIGNNATTSSAIWGNLILGNNLITGSATGSGYMLNVAGPGPSGSLSVSGSVLVSGSYAMSGSFTQVGYTILPTVSQSLNFADDVAAAAGGVPLGGLYRNGNFILIRIS